MSMNAVKTPQKSQTISAFADNLTALFEELQLACKWHRPSILVATYQSRLVKLEAQIKLEKRLRRSGQEIFFFNLNAEPIDLPLFMSNYPYREKTVFFVSGLISERSTNPNLFRALNIRRELLVDNQIRVVFWLTPEEAAALPIQALDFWAFRHRVLEFFNRPTPRRVKSLIQELDWDYWDPQVLRAQLPTGLAQREELLKEIPDWDAAPWMRSKLLLMLAVLHWVAQDYKESQKLLEIGLNLAKSARIVNLEARYYAAFGMLYQSQGRHNQAIKSYQRSIKLEPNYAETWSRLGLVFQEKGHNDESLAAAFKATKLDPKIPMPWVTIGDLQSETGHFDLSIQAYQKAIALNSRDAALWIKLGDAYASKQKPAKALPPYKKAHQLNPNDGEIWLKLGYVYLSLDRSNSAIRAFYKSTRLNPLAALPWKLLGDTYRKHNRLIYARRAYKKALKLAPNEISINESLNACYSLKSK